MSDKAIVYGGAFNPPTIAHQVIAQAAVEFAEGIDASFWLMLSGERADKSIYVPRRRRIEYGAALLGSLDTPVKLNLCTHELDQERTQTIDTVRHLNQAYPDTEFTWIFGADSIQTMPIWEQGEWLIENLSMLVVQRAGCEIELAPNMTELNVIAPDVSSTLVRERVKDGLPISGMVPDVVLELLSS